MGVYIFFDEEDLVGKQQGFSSFLLHLHLLFRPVDTSYSFFPVKIITIIKETTEF